MSQKEKLWLRVLENLRQYKKSTKHYLNRTQVSWTIPSFNPPRIKWLPGTISSSYHVIFFNDSKIKITLGASISRRRVGIWHRQKLVELHYRPTCILFKNWIWCIEDQFRLRAHLAEFLNLKQQPTVSLGNGFYTFAVNLICHQAT